ncbi:hypothetical protein IYQ92_02990 [Streptococcus sp. HF-1907]|uniref:hypothetical protein n=1 Tax=Streptococcus sp. HF-1907 TaxID=2785793 RepID=UPI00189DECE4|nr:hypothetical protein [Streptococcus sp. HF-1907]MBF7094235.1 hypothetical protein [Streptococcus sp. HF-1907]
MKSFDAFKRTLSPESLKEVYNQAKEEVPVTELEGSEAFSIALAQQMAVDLVEMYHLWLKEDEK